MTADAPVAVTKHSIGDSVMFVAWSAGTFDHVSGTVLNVWADEHRRVRYDIQRKPGWAYTGIYEEDVKPEGYVQDRIIAGTP